VAALAAHSAAAAATVARHWAALFSGGTCAANTPPHNTSYCGGVRITPQRRPRRRRAAAAIRHKRIAPNHRLGPPLAYWPVARPTGQYRRRGLVSATKWWPPSGQRSCPFGGHTLHVARNIRRKPKPQQQSCALRCGSMVSAVWLLATCGGNNAESCRLVFN
jgi:hypothetical protein